MVNKRNPQILVFDLRLHRGDHVHRGRRVCVAGIGIAQSGRRGPHRQRAPAGQSAHPRRASGAAGSQFEPPAYSPAPAESPRVPAASWKAIRERDYATAVHELRVLVERGSDFVAARFYLGICSAADATIGLAAIEQLRAVIAAPASKYSGTRAFLSGQSAAGRRRHQAADEQELKRSSRCTATLEKEAHVLLGQIR